MTNAAIVWLGIAFVVAVATTYALARVAERYGRQLGVLDQPRAGEVQQAPCRAPAATPCWADCGWRCSSAT